VDPSRRCACAGRSPTRWNGRRQRGVEREVVVERVVERIAASGPANFPVLTKTNYNDWSLLMKIKLEARGLWNAIDPGGVDRQVDRMALDALCSAVPSEMLSTVGNKGSAKEAWESIKTMRIGDEGIRKASAQKVRRDYETLAFRDGESVEDFALHLSGVVS
jgi:hypothetical protein